MNRYVNTIFILWCIIYILYRFYYVQLEFFNDLTIDKKQIRIISCYEIEIAALYFIDHLSKSLDRTYHHISIDGNFTYTPEDDVLDMVLIPYSGSTCFKQYTEFFNNVIQLRKNNKKIYPPPLQPYQNRWIDEIYWNKDAELVSLKSRPLLMYFTGEVFSPHRPKPDLDIVLYRAKYKPIGKTLTGHFIQGIQQSYIAQYQNKLSYEPKKFQYRQHFDKSLISTKKGFISITNSAVIKRHHHFYDATVRFALCSLLNDNYKSCHGLGRSSFLKNRTIISNCDGDAMTVFKCMEPFKFTIAMENSQVEGYISEKIFNAKMANTVPIYFGASDVHKYFNMDSFIFCNVSDSRILQLRHAGNKFKGNKKFSDSIMVNYTKTFLHDELENCMQKIIQIDKNDTKYIEMINTPLYNEYDNSIIDGKTLADGMMKLISTIDT